MGVDAGILVRLNGDANVAQARTLGYRLGDAVGADFFWIDRKRGRGPITVLDPAEEPYLLELIPANVGGVLSVNVVSRYYGPYYERGDWPRLSAVLDWLRFNVKGRVYYGGDNGNEYSFVDDSFMDEMYIHWATHGRLPYAYNGPSQENEKNIRFGGGPVFAPWPTCDLCQVPMSQYGWGGNYAAFRCAGCGHDIYTRDNGTTWLNKDTDV